MGYSTKFKLRVLKHTRMGVSPIQDVACLRRVPKQTIYRWMRLFDWCSIAGLENKNPGAKPERINETFERIVLATWNAHQRGVHKMWRDTHATGFGVSERQITKIYRRHNLKISKRTRPNQIKFVKYEWPTPNSLWHTDWTHCPFTGKNLIAFIDDHSRFLVHAEYFDNATTENTILAFQHAIQKYGNVLLKIL